MNLKKIPLLFCCIFVCFTNLIGKENFFTYPEFQKKACVKDSALYEKGEEDYVSFWADCAKEIDWFQDWEKTHEWNRPYAKWFLGGKLNISYNCLDRHIKNGLGEKIALLALNENGERREVSYNALYYEVNRLSNVMKKLGVKKGDRVAIYMPMNPEGCAAMLACTRIGAIHTVIFGGIGAKSVRDRIDDAEAKLLITADGSYRKGKIISYKSEVDKILDDCPSIEKVLVFQHTGADTDLKKGRDYWYHEIKGTVASFCPPEHMDAEDELFILYTSGTTGKPKGILHTTGGYLVGVHNTFKWVFDIKPEDIFWCTADIGWITGHSYVVYGPMSNAATQVIYEGALDYPAKNTFSKIIDENKVSIFYTAPTLIRMFMKWGQECLADSHLDSLRLLGTIGEPINPYAWVWYSEKIGHGRCPIVDTWFQTETGALVISPLPGVTPLVPGSVTQALPGYDVAVLGNRGERQSKGLLAIRKPFPSMMRGVYKDHDRYVKTYWSKWDGKYYLAGDNAREDQNGYFWIGGRCDEVLKVAGHRIGTAEIENALIEHPAVSESAVVGVKDQTRGQQILAFVCIKDQCEVSENIEQELKQVVVDYLGAYCRPQRVLIVNSLPKTRSGKILRRIIKNFVEDVPVGNVSTLSNPHSIEELEPICKELNEELYPKSRGEHLLRKITAKPVLKAMPDPVLLGSQEIVDKVRPTLEQHLVGTNYDRLHLVEQFLDHYHKEKEKNQKLEPLEALATFVPDINVEPYKGSSCHGLAINLLDEIPKELHGYHISAVLPKRFQQQGWPVLSHTAVAIPYQNPVDKSDKGIVLLDPNFDIEVPIVLKEDGCPFVVDMREKGYWVFALKEKNIFCWDAKKFSEDPIMTYDLRHYLNPVAVSVKPMIATDERISMVSRDRNGSHLAHLNIIFKNEQVSSSVEYKKRPLISFVDFFDDHLNFDSTFTNRFRLQEKELNSSIKKIISDVEVLKTLRKQYLEIVAVEGKEGEFFR